MLFFRIDARLFIIYNTAIDTVSSTGISKSNQLLRPVTPSAITTLPKSSLAIIKKYKEVLALLIPVFLSTTILFYKLGTLPKTVSLDEFRLGYFAANLNGAPYVPYFIKSDAYSDNHPTFYLYQILLSYKIFGPNPFALRFFAAFYGILTVAGFYLLIKRVSGRNLALIGSLVLAFSYKFIALSRWNSEAPIYFFFLTLAGYLLVSQQISILQGKSVSYRKAFLLGIVVGIMQHTYFSSQAFIPIFPVLLGTTLLFCKAGLKKLTLALIVFLSGFMFAIYPLLITIKNAPSGSFNSRKGELVILRSDVSIKDKMYAVKVSTLNTLKMFHFRGSEEPCYSFPGSKFLDPLSGLLLIIGIIYSIYKLPLILSFTFFSLFLTSLVPSFLSVIGATPHEVRAGAVIIFSALYITLSFDLLRQIIKPRFLKLVVFALAFGFIALTNLNNYFIKQMSVSHFCLGPVSSREVEKSVKENMSTRNKLFYVYNPFF